MQLLELLLALVERLAEEKNRRMARERPALAARRRSLQKKLDRNKGHADKVLAACPALEEHAGRAFLTDKLGELAQRRSDLEQGIAEVDEALKRVELDQVTAETVRSTLREFSRVYACLTSFEQKELMRLVLRRAEISKRQIVLELHAVPAPRLAVAQSLQRSEPPNWLPDQDSNLEPSG
jgi:chromosome segregation ATPase